MGAAALLGLGLLAAGSATKGYGENQGLKAQQTALDTENLRQAGYSGRVNKMVQGEIQNASPTTRLPAIGQQQVASSTALGDLSRTLAGAAGSVASSSPGANQGAISSATGGAAASGQADANILGALRAPQWDAQDSQRRLVQLGLDRSRISNFAQGSASVLPLEMQAAALRGQRARIIGQLMQLAGQASIGYGAGGAAGAGASTKASAMGSGSVAGGSSAGVSPYGDW